MAPRLAVFISGSGTNLQALIDAIREGRLQAEIELVVSNRKAAYGFVRAAEANIPTLYFPLKPYLDDGRGRAQYDIDLAQQVAPYKPDLLVLAGWMHIVSATFLDYFPNRVINLHPALPNTFAGTEAIQRTYDAFQRGEVAHGGCMVHYVVPEVDAGPVLKQSVVPVLPGEPLAAFEARMHDAEHTLIVEATGLALDQIKDTERQ